MKRLFIIVLSIVMILSFSACTEKDLTSGKTAEEILEESILKSAEWESYEMDMSTEMEMNIPGQGNVEMTMQGTGQVFMKPMKMHMTLNMEMPQMEEMQTLEQYMVQENETFVIYQNMQDQWYKMVIDDPSLTEMMTMDPMENIQLFMKYLKSAEMVSEEVIKERDTVAIELTVSFDMYKELLEKNESLDVGGMSAMGIFESLSDMGDLTYTVWVDKSSLEIVKYYMDFSEAMSKIGEALASQEGFPAELSDIYKDSKMVMSMEIFNQNNVDDFEIPEAAKNAQDLPFMN